MRQYRLAPAYAKYTGILNNVYPIKDGVFTIVDPKQEEPKVLIEHYGAKLIVADEKKEEVKK